MINKIIVGPDKVLSATELQCVKKINEIIDFLNNPKEKGWYD